MFQTDFPAGSITASDEDRMLLYRSLAHHYMIYLSIAMPALEVKKYQPALKRLLAE